MTGLRATKATHILLRPDWTSRGGSSMRTSRWLAGAAGLVVAARAAAIALPALADDSTGIVTGHFTDGTTPLSVTVTLQTSDFSFVVSTPTDQTGGYTFTDVPAGTYTVNFAFQN